ncbi:hypothetical protein [Gracilibacillus sp. YIM 98692]|uniref:hypothetical protein n=1 Tax=Gracilibacillus sp. YIM 98692 TaxID=2663532 RepID=UPI0013D06C0D|nr:hypothetical protein [Gracilibacillus sp. YIM 98692]
MNRKILLAVGDPTYSQILTDYIQVESDAFQLSAQEVMHYQYMEELIETEQPDILIVHDYYLPNTIPFGKEREKEWLNYFESLRTRYDDQLRIVFLCERERQDPFLRQLVNANILDIFETNKINMEEFIEQLKDRPRYARVAKFKANTLSHPAKSDEDAEDTSMDEQAADEEIADDKDVQDLENEPKDTSNQQKKEKPVVEKVVQKKVVNKQVVKRRYNVQITNEVEKVVGVPVEKKLILIGSPFPRSGSTFIAHLLAESLRDLDVPVTYIESPYSVPYTFDRFYGQKYTSNYYSKFYQFTNDLDPEQDIQLNWSVEGVDMISKHPNKESIYTENDIPFETFMKLLLSNQSTVTIVDVGTDWLIDVYRDLVDIATDIHMVMEPDISNMQYIDDPDNHHMEYFRELFQLHKTKLIGNRFNQDILKNPVMKDLYKDQFITTFPAYPSSLLFQAQYEGVFAKKTLQQYDKRTQKKRGKALIDKQLEPILDGLVPKELTNQKQSFFKGLWNKKIRVSKQT